MFIYVHPYSLKNTTTKCAFCHGVCEGMPTVAETPAGEPVVGWYACDSQSCRDNLKFCVSEFKQRAARLPASDTADNVKNIMKAAAKADDAIAKAKAMPGDFTENLFQTAQGVKHDSMCPHDLPYYACMGCSH